MNDTAPPTLREAKIARGLNRQKASPAALEIANKASLAAATELRSARGEAPKAPEAEAPEPAPAPARVIHIDPAAMQLAEYVTNSFFATVPTGTRPSDFHLNPGPFELVAEHMTRFSNVRLVESGWIADGIVVDHLAPSFAVIHIHNVVELGPRESAMRDLVPAGYIIRQGDVHEEAWVIERKQEGGNVVMNKGCFHTSFENARSYLLTHATVARAPASKKY